MEFVIVLAILAIVVLVVSTPLRRASADGGSGCAGGDSRTGGARRDVAGDAVDVRTAKNELADLEAARKAKYREIREAELDHRTGKLSDADFEATDRTLRAEAIKILRALDRARG